VSWTAAQNVPVAIGNAAGLFQRLLSTVSKDTAESFPGVVSVVIGHAAGLCPRVLPKLLTVIERELGCWSQIVLSSTAIWRGVGSSLTVVFLMLAASQRREPSEMMMYWDQEMLPQRREPSEMMLAWF
jgi:hypothetical protein